MAAAEDISADVEARRQLTRKMWAGRLKGVRRNVEVWQVSPHLQHAMHCMVLVLSWVLSGASSS